MKLLEGVVAVNGAKAKGEAKLRSSDGQVLSEYGTVNNGVYATCFVLASPGDIITAPFALRRGVADFADLVVDGIRRDSVSATRQDRSFSRIFRRACYCEKLKNGKTGGLKSCHMKVQSRDIEKGKIYSTSVIETLIRLDVAWKEGKSPSAVGTLDIQLFQILDGTSQIKDINSQGNVSKDHLTAVRRAPAFSEFATWRDFNPYIDPSATPPSFEIRYGPFFSLLSVL
jgi:hypothetical protein